MPLLIPRTEDRLRSDGSVDPTGMACSEISSAILPPKALERPLVPVVQSPSNRASFAAGILLNDFSLRPLLPKWIVPCCVQRRNFIRTRFWVMHRTMRQSWTTTGWDKILRDPTECTGQPAHVGIVRQLSASIESGLLPEGVRLPPTRFIAKRLGVGRNTVLFALDCLVENGLLTSKERSGFFVAPRGAEPRPYHDAARPTVNDPWTRRLAAMSPAALEIPAYQKPTGEQGVSFRFGQFDMSLFPASDWRECERASSGLSQIELWGRDMVDGDDPELVHQIRKHVLPQAGIWARPDEIIVTLGAQEGRYLVALLLAKAGGKVGVENPCSLELLRTLKFVGAEYSVLDMDAHGAVASAAMTGCEAIVVTPGLQFPTTTAMPTRRRLELLAQAEIQDFVIVEDTYETEFLHERGGLPSLKSLDKTGRVIYIGSLARQIAPGLRMAYIVAPPSVIKHLRLIRRLMHRHPPANNQRSLAIFLERGYYRKFLRHTSAVLEARGEMLIAAIQSNMPFLTWQHQEGTSAFWFDLPPDVQGQHLAKAAGIRGVLLDSDRQAFISHDPKRNGIRLCVSYVRDADIPHAVEAIAKAFIEVNSLSERMWS